jgi:ABC-type phosphate/phosphonate transport system substrate-binding protein
MANFTIVDQKQDNFGVVHTTELYPAWTVTVSPSVDKGLADKVKAALLKITAGDAASKSAKIVGFVEPVSLDEMANTLKDLQLPPYK